MDIVQIFGVYIYISMYGYFVYKSQQSRYILPQQQIDALTLTLMDDTPLIGMQFCALLHSDS